MPTSSISVRSATPAARARAAAVQRLLPDNAPTTLEEQIGSFDPSGSAPAGRPYVFTNFAVTVDGRATLGGRSGAIGSSTDTAMLMALRAAGDAVMVGAGTIRAENYGRVLPGAEARAGRERRGLPADPLTVVVSDSLELPWEAGLFTCGEGEVVIVTASDREPPATSTPVEVDRHPGGVDLTVALGRLRERRDIRGLLCEGGPTLHGGLLAGGLVDELFITLGPKLGGGDGPGLAEGLAERPVELELRWLLGEGDELFARYAVRG